MAPQLALQTRRYWLIQIVFSLTDKQIKPVINMFLSLRSLPVWPDDTEEPAPPKHQLLSRSDVYLHAQELDGDIGLTVIIILFNFFF